MTQTEQEAKLEPEQAREVLPAVRAHEAMVTRGEVSVDDIVKQRAKIKQVMETVMTDGVHYGKVPGVGKPTLLKPGAEVLNVTFRLAPSYHSDRLFDDAGHLTVIARCVLTHAPSGMVLGEGEGMCSTRESKYAYRKASRMCPQCGSEAILKSKYPPRETDYPGAQPTDEPGWYCNRNKGGCGANFRFDDPEVVNQETGKKENTDLADSWNTVLKMADKRALVAAILNVTAASDIFTQDVEDQPAAAAAEERPQEESRPQVKLPGSWAEFGERMTALGIPDYDQAEWLREALDGLERPEKWAKSRRLLVALTEKGGVELGEADPRGLIQSSIAEVFDGLAVIGPPWRIHPGEEHLPTREQWLEQQAENGTAAEPEDGAEQVQETLEPSESAEDADDIPF